MRKTLFAMMLALSLASPFAAAHDDADEPRGPRMEFMLDHLLDAVNPTDAQRTQIEAIADKYKPQMKSLHEQMHALHKQMHAEIEALLTDEQRQKLEETHRHHHHES